jgi:Fibronectin type III domain
MHKHRAKFAMPGYRTLGTWLISGAVATSMAIVAVPSANAASKPSAPSPATATPITGGSNDFRVTWSTAAANGSAIKRYVIKVKGQSAPQVQVTPDKRSYDWTGSVAGTSPLTFQVRAVNGVGAGPWAEAVVDSSTGGGSTSPTPDAPAPVTDFGLPYSAGSYFKSRVDNASVNATRTAAFHEFMRTAPDQKSISWPKINMNADWAMSYHVGKSTDPIWRLKGGNTSNSRLQILTKQGFHMADSVADTFPTGTQDRPGVMVDPVFGYTVQFADAVVDKSSRTITVSNAGIMWHSSNGLDYRNPKSDDNRNFTSRGRILDSMVIRRDVLDKAIANNTGLGYVLHLYFVETNTADGVKSPMVGAESGKYGWGAEGERIRLKPSIDLKARGLTGAALAVARTLQENGAYLGDNSGSSTQIKASQAAVYAGTNMATDMFQGKISWDDFQVVAKR